MVSGKKNVSKYLSYLLRHAPESIGLEMDNHGWVSVDQLIDRLNAGGKYEISLKDIRNIVANDAKGRFRLDEGFKRIKACQGHTIAWVEPELTIAAPPHFLYHGTTVKALEKIEACGFISRMQRHAVHMQAELEPAWASAVRWHAKPVVLKIDSARMYEDGFSFGISDNGVWCTEQVPAEYIAGRIYDLRGDSADGQTEEIR